MTPTTRAVLTKLCADFRALYGDRLVNMTLYGSQARGDAESESDIDVLVVLKGPVDAGKEISRTGGIVAGLSLEHDVVVACVFMDEESFLTRQGPFLRNVRREGIPI